MITLDPGRLYTSGEISGWLGYADAGWLYAHKDELFRLGFPKPIPKPGHPRWRGDALIRWSQGRVAIEADTSGNVIDLAKLAQLRSRQLGHTRRRAS